jgi:hypothetical protein
MATGWDIQVTRQVVAAELGRRGYAASPFAGNVPAFDLLAADDRGYVVPVQVKAIKPASSWQFRATQFIDIEIGEAAQTVTGFSSLRNPNIVCILVQLGRAAIADEFYLMRMSDLQTPIHANYTPRKLPKNLQSVHCALWQKDVLAFRDRWDILEEAFREMRAAALPRVER